MTTGTGASGKVTTKELASFANAPSILIAGRVEVEEDILINPPSPTATITFNPLPGSHTNYSILVSGLNTGSVYVATMSNNADGDFYQFRVIAESEGTCMYVITKIGARPLA